MPRSITSNRTRSPTRPARSVIGVPASEYFLGKAFHLCIDMDKMIGGKYDESLTALKSVVETGAKPADAAKPAATSTAK